ncbi:lymphokine-activated killer T-cell-originated protein kinase homolog isoform X1 [Syngnathus acus]|uniref:lymphokine-activated killer T-cell-originated protein kinase homolog isoform X1 n=1 Tax=Syngnathus acus TaxID=161584 RepID=UPI00188648B9|nr:lymphokine-activated killer T-cell-originated protein kinase homolog isoform X1 [Syngnathus acus]XP_037100446.1 lymphokine-activated killer T-cell-originated protein kinase homolog isoform X1 [Syngnathus acus]
MAGFTTPQMSRIRSFASGGSPINIPASPFMKKLGCGTGVSVYLMDRVGQFNASPWAIKKLNSKCASKQAEVYLKRLKEEAKVLKGIDHPNIVGFRALATAKDGSECLAMEFGGEQSLNDLMEKRRKDGLRAFPAADVEKVALHVARGLQYLHNEKQLLHGDIKSCNVVIKGNFDAVKICDVGVSLQLDENMTVSDPEAEYIGTEPWNPKEALEGGEITDKADIFAYGLTLWEMMTLAMPHMDMPEDDEEQDEDESMEDSFDEDAYYAQLGTRPPLDGQELGESYKKMMELFYVCTEEDPKKRPSATQIVQALEDNALEQNKSSL